MKKARSTDFLRLPQPVEVKAGRRGKANGISLHQFVATAVSGKPAAMDAATFFAAPRRRADVRAFDRLMRRQGGEPPRPDDTITEG